MKSIAVVNQKGGVGKSTTAAALAGGLCLCGRRVLAVDLDAQGNLSHTMRAQPRPGKSILEVLLGTLPASEAEQATAMGDLLPASKGLSGADAFLSETGKEYRLREALQGLSGAYDYCIIDSPPALGIATVNALTGADMAIVPAQADIYSLQGVEQVLQPWAESRRDSADPVQPPVCAQPGGAGADGPAGPAAGDPGLPKRHPGGHSRKGGPNQPGEPVHLCARLQCGQRLPGLFAGGPGHIMGGIEHGKKEEFCNRPGPV